LFDATFNNALVSRLATSSIVAGAALSALTIAPGAPARISPSPSRVLLRVAPLRVFCCCDRQAELHRRFFDRDRLPLPADARPGALSGHYPAFRYYSVRGLLLGHQPSSSRSPAYRPSRSEPSRPPRGEMQRFRRDRVATTPPARQVSGIAAERQLTQPRNALRRFTLVRHHGAPMASFRPALTGASRRPRYLRPSSGRPVNSGPRPCLFDVGFPLSGLQDRTHTSDLYIRARHTPPRATRSGLSVDSRVAVTQSHQARCTSTTTDAKWGHSSRRAGATASCRSQGPLRRRARERCGDGAAIQPKARQIGDRRRWGGVCRIACGPGRLPRRRPRTASHLPLTAPREVCRIF
jgi:hypothetical protein